MFGCWINGGPGSGIHKTTDRGQSWTEVKAGLPSNQMGRIGPAGAPSDPNMLYAIIVMRKKGSIDQQTLVKRGKNDLHT